MFLDRDGTINAKAPDGEYIYAPSQMVLLSGAAQAIRRLNDAQLPVIIVTNQRGIALGRMTEADLCQVHAHMAAELWRQARAHVDAIYYCPHALGACRCRKPAPGLLLRARHAQPDIDFAQSIMIGDSLVDVQAGDAAGVRTLLLGRDAADLSAAVSLALARPATPSA